MPTKLGPDDARTFAHTYDGRRSIGCTNPANDRKFRLTCFAINAYSRVDRAASRWPKRIINQFRDAMVTC
jgi:hypothetical protein